MTGEKIKRTKIIVKRKCLLKIKFSLSLFFKIKCTKIPIPNNNALYLLSSAKAKNNTDRYQQKCLLLLNNLFSWEYK
tara:strand:+ start:132 stop:362 length:231 start_codon:yes stop_codon:yes gene_type:complete